MDLTDLSQFCDSDMSIDEFIQLQNISLNQNHEQSLKHEQDLAYLQSEQKDLEKKIHKNKNVHFLEPDKPKQEDAKQEDEPKQELDEPKPSLNELRKLRLKYFT